MKEPKKSSNPFTEPIVPQPEYDPDPPVVIVYRPLQQAPRKRKAKKTKKAKQTK